MDSDVYKGKSGSPWCIFCLGFMLEIIKERFWRLVISCLYTYSMQRGTSPHGRQLCSQPEVSEAQGFRSGAGAAAAWTPPVGVK